MRARLIMVCVVITVIFGAACSGDTKKSYKIGIVNNISTLDEIITGFKQHMTQLGYVEGERVTYLYHGPVSNLDELQKAADNLAAADMDLILSLATPSTIITKEATTQTGVPVVFCAVTDPLGAGIVEDIQYPGKNITGVSLGSQEKRRFEWLVRITPGIKKVYTPYNPADPSPVLALETARRTAEKLGVELITQQIKTLEELDQVIEHIPAEADAIFLLPDTLTGGRVKQLSAAAVKCKIPIASATCSGVTTYDAVVSYGVKLTAIGKQGARLADMIFHGVKPADIPVETAELFLAINLKTANAMGLKIPDQILRQADIIVR